MNGNFVTVVYTLFIGHIIPMVSPRILLFDSANQYTIRLTWAATRAALIAVTQLDICFCKSWSDPNILWQWAHLVSLRIYKKTVRENFYSGGLDRHLPECERLSVSDIMGTRQRPSWKAQVSSLFTTSELQSEHMTSYYTGTGDDTRSKPTSTWASKPPYCLYW